MTPAVRGRQAATLTAEPAQQAYARSAALTSAPSPRTTTRRTAGSFRRPAASTDRVPGPTMAVRAAATSREETP
ncbi:hypothetical protein [Streptomyces sp. NPDC016172]|uniref:hypothetical protein n=1 Tax=Streptomyces sp. NPDC016172 TaxID=3364964 RepID=UPI00370100C2